MNAHTFLMWTPTSTCRWRRRGCSERVLRFCAGLKAALPAGGGQKAPLPGAAIPWRHVVAWKTRRSKLQASVIFALARVMPMVRMNSAIWPFWRADTCSMRARMVDLAGLARRVRAGIGLPLGFLRWTHLSHASSDRLRQAASAQTSDGVVVGRGIAQHAPVEAGTIGDLAAADEAIASADRDAALIAKAWDRDVDPKLAAGQRPTLGELQRPARVGILLRGLGWSGQISAALLPALIASFLAAALRCLGAATSAASTICPPIGR